MVVKLVRHDGAEERKNVPDGSTVADVFPEIATGDFTALMNGSRVGPNDRVRHGTKIVTTHNKIAAA